MDNTEQQFESVSACEDLVGFTLGVTDVVMDLVEESVRLLRSDRDKQWVVDGERTSLVQDNDAAQNVMLNQLSKHLDLNLRVLDLIREAREISRETHLSLVQMPNEVQGCYSNEELGPILSNQVKELETKLNETIFAIKSMSQLRE